jgi:hypothetical protein
MRIKKYFVYTQKFFSQIFRLEHLSFSVLDLALKSNIRIEKFTCF